MAVLLLGGAYMCFAFQLIAVAWVAVFLAPMLPLQRAGYCGRQLACCCFIACTIALRARIAVCWLVYQAGVFECPALALWCSINSMLPWFQ
jgi:hypothetical protein